MKHLLSNWSELLPLAGLIVMAAIGIVIWLRRKPIDDSEIERQRRAYLNKVGRIVEGQILEISEDGLHRRRQRNKSTKHIPVPAQRKLTAATHQRHAAAPLLHLLNLRRHLRNRSRRHRPRRAPPPQSRRRRSNRQRKIRPLESQQFNPASRRLVRLALNYFSATSVAVRRPM